MNIQMECELGGLPCPGSDLENQRVPVQIPVEEPGGLNRLTILQWDERVEVAIRFEKIDPQWQATVSGNAQSLQEQLTEKGKPPGHSHSCIF
jgi:hypothetical protein